MTPKEKYESIEKLNNAGRKFKVIAYYDSSTIKIKFEDGGDEILANSSAISKGQVKHPREKQLEFEGTKWTNTNNENFTIVKYSDSQNVKVQYEDGIQSTYSLQKIKMGQVRHPKHNGQNVGNVKNVVGMKITNGQGLSFRIIEQKLGDSLIEFENTKTTKWVKTSNATKGTVKDQFHLSVLGVGYLGDFDKTLPYAERAYNKWKDMLDRCYGDKEQHVCYVSVYVSIQWKCFANFLNDIKYLKGFDMWLKDSKMELDKDLLSGKNKCYSKDTCLFLTHKENIGIIGKGSEKHGTPKLR